jgi:hypothetical protein
MLGGRPRNFSTAAGFETTMLSMRVCAGLVLSVALCLGAGVAPAGAATYCADAFPATATGGACPGPPTTIQGALDLASAHPGPDTVGLNSGYYSGSPNLTYSDGGQPDNAVTITAMPTCGKYGCDLVQVTGGASTGSLLSFGGGGGADVTVSGFGLYADHGAVALTLPPGGTAKSVSMGAADGGVVVRMEGTPARPSVMYGGGASARRSGSSRGVGVDVIGQGVLEQVRLSGDIGARVRPGGHLDVFAGTLQSTVGVTGASARVVGTVVNQTYQGDRTNGERAIAFEAACAAPDSPDAELSVTNVTVIGGGRPDTTGVRAVGRGGNGSACDATARMSSTILSRVTTPLDASGEPGTGAAPDDGRARVEAAYSNFDAEAIVSSGPAEIETSKPGRNMDTSSGFQEWRLESSTGPEALLDFVGLRVDSPMINRGDPAEPEPWERPWIRVAYGRRDIGAYEYFFAPGLGLHTTPSTPIPPGRPVRIMAYGITSGSEPVDVRWTLSDGTASSGWEVIRTYPRPGAYKERVVATDPAGHAVDNSLTIRVVPQRILSLRLTRPRFRPTKDGEGSTRRGTAIDIDVAASDTVVFRVERHVRRKGSHRRRWVRVRGSFGEQVEPQWAEPLFSGWVAGKRLTPGRYRLVATASAAPKRPARARFTIIR